MNEKCANSANTGECPAEGKNTAKQAIPGINDDLQAVAKNLSGVKHKVVVLSGKGGVGKSTVAAALAWHLAKEGASVGLVDTDIHGPSIPVIFGLDNQKAVFEDGKIFPVCVGDLKIISISFFLQSQKDSVIWRGPMKAAVIKQFLLDVNWGQLDYLIIDSPPGTGDEPLSVCQLIPEADGAVIVTTPQTLSTSDVQRSVQFCRKLNFNIIGIVENMSGFLCPHCGKESAPFKSGGGITLAKDENLPFLGTIPMDPRIMEACDSGNGFANAPNESFKEIVTNFKNNLNNRRSKMKIAIPTAEGKLCSHFGHCETFAFVEADTESKTIGEISHSTPPPHEPGVLPQWLKENNVDIVIAGGMGMRAQQLFNDAGIKVVVGAPPEKPGTLVRNFLDGTLQTGDNLCDH